MKLIALIPIAFLLLPCCVKGQDSISNQTKFIKHIETSTLNYERKISRCSDKMLSRFSKEENKIKRKLQKIDHQKAEQLFADSISVFSNAIKNRIYLKIPLSGYLDTTHLTLQFLNKQGLRQEKSHTASKNLEALQGKLQLTDNIHNYIQNRKAELQSQLIQYAAFTKNFQRLGKQVFYYKQQLAEYKSMYETPSKLENKVIATLKQLPAYNDFISKNSLISSLFNLPSDYNVTRSIEGLQTRCLTDQIIGQRLGTDPASRVIISQQMEQAKAKFSELKTKFPNLNSAAEIPDMPHFKPNPLKTKSFLKRLEYGGNIQFQKNNTYYPTTSDLAGQVGYKFHKNGTAGLGIAYKLGLGRGWNHIAFTHQGIGLRSYADWKLKGTFYVNGGYELNYVNSFNSLQQLKETHSWQESALLGISKKYTINPKLKGNILILYDFLAPGQHPQSNKFKIRLGYTM